MPFTANHIIKITIGERFFLHRETSSKESLLLLFNIWNSSTVFPKLKNPDGSNVTGEDLDVHRPGAGLCPHTLGTGDRVRVLMADDLSPGALYELQASGYH